MSSRPLPVPDEMSAPFWAACADHVLALPRCSDCQEFTFPADDICPNCHSLDPRFVHEAVSGAGKVRTWTVMRKSFLQGFDTPFMLVDVQLDDQPAIRLIGRLLDGPETAVKAGDPVVLAFEDLAPGTSVLAFRLENAA